MTDKTCYSLIQKVSQQSLARIKATEFEDQCLLVLPYLYPDNTEMTVAVEDNGFGRFIVTDNGEAADFAFASGVSESVIRDRVRKTKKRFNMAQNSSDELIIETNEDNLGDAIISISNAVNDLALVYRQRGFRRKRVLSESLEVYLSSTGRTFRKNVGFDGETGERQFDYLVVGTHQQLLLNLFEETSRKRGVNRAKILAFDYQDVKRVATNIVPESAVLVDDTTAKARTSFTAEASQILQSSGQEVILWEDHVKINDLLAAA